MVFLGWLVGWLFLPLRQYFSLYRAVSQREGERRETKCSWVPRGQFNMKTSPGWLELPLA